jgi:hypothetical protein
MEEAAKKKASDIIEPSGGGVGNYNEPGKYAEKKAEEVKQPLKEVAAEDIIPPAPETKFKEQKNKPAFLDLDKATLAPAEIAKVVDEIKNTQSRLASIKATIDNLNAQYNLEKKKIEDEGGKIANDQQFKNLVNSLATMLEKAQLQTVKVDNEFITLKNEVKDVAFKPDYKWKLDKLLSKFGKDAEVYLERAVSGAQNLAEKETIREIVVFPSKEKNAADNGAAQDTFFSQIKNVYNDLKDFLGVIFNLDSEIAAITEEFKEEK